MKKYVLSLVTLFGSVAFVNAQNAKVSSIEINKMPQPCVMAEYSIPAEMVEGAMRKKFSDAKLGSGDKTKDGFRMYKGVLLPEIAKEKMDVYYKVEDKKPTSMVYMLTSKGYDNFMKMDPDSVAMKNSIEFLNKFVKDATAFHLTNEIKKQEEVIDDVEKSGKKLAKNADGLARDKAKVESKISKNAIEIGGLKTEMENQQKALELVKQKTATLEEMNALKKEVGKQEDVTKKATKKYDNAVKDAADYKEDLAKTEKELSDNAIAQDASRAQLEAERKKLEELKTQLSSLR